MKNQKSLSLLLAGIFVTIIFTGCSNKDETIDMSKNKDTNTGELNIIEIEDGESYDLTADMFEKNISGRSQRMMAYNASIPGPIFKVKQGSQIKLNFTNNTEVENTIHSHGIRLKNEFDGVPNVTQAPVKAGETFEYTIDFPDPGFYWYHPHAREDMTQEMGLYGGFYVLPEDDNYWGKVDREEFIFLDDILMNRNELADFDDDFVNHTLMGRFGNVMLVNGEEDYSLKVRKGDIVRFIIVNVANVRPFNFEIEGVKLKLVGSDGGRYKNEEFIDSVIIAPSERYIVEAYFDSEGKFEIKNATPKRNYNLGEIIVTEVEKETSSAGNFEDQRKNGFEDIDADQLEKLYENAPDKFLSLGIEMKMGGMMMGQDSSMMGMPCHQMPDGSMMGDCGREGGWVETSDIEWEDDMAMMNQMSDDKNIEWQIIDEETDDVNEEISWKFNQGDYVKVRIFNDPDSEHPMQHPIHFHGQRFLVLKEDGIKNENLVWKDTVLIPKGRTTDILIEMSNPGVWMAHCHIAEHLHSGMMFSYEVR